MSGLGNPRPGQAVERLPGCLRSGPVIDPLGPPRPEQNPAIGTADRGLRQAEDQEMDVVAGGCLRTPSSHGWRSTGAGIEGLP